MMSIDERRGQKPAYDLKERTFCFGVKVLQFVGMLPKTFMTVELGRQLIRSATSIGANVEEADGAESRRDTAHKMGIARKEARESHYWLRTLVAAELVPPPRVTEAKALMQEAGELAKILSAIIRKLTPG